MECGWCSAPARGYVLDAHDGQPTPACAACAAIGAVVSKGMRRDPRTGFLLIPWSDEEKADLKTLWPSASRAEIKARFPHRSWMALRQMAHVLGASHSRPRGPNVGRKPGVVMVNGKRVPRAALEQRLHLSRQGLWKRLRRAGEDATALTRPSQRRRAS